MHTEYLNRFIDALKGTAFYKGSVKADDYEEGIGLLFDVFSEAKEKGGTLYFVGNGGSAAIASHMTSDFKKNGCMKTGALLDASVITCFGNDFGYDHIYSKQLEQIGEEGDVLVGISSSGNSPDIVNAVLQAKKIGMKVITFSGFKSDNKIKSMGDINVYTAIEQYGIVESVHITILQQVVDAILDRDGAFI